MAAVIFSVVIAFGQQSPTQAAPDTPPPVEQSLLPQTVGVGVLSNDAVVLTFEQPMDPATVSAAITILPEKQASLRWNAARTSVSVAPDGRWRAGETYLIVVADSATSAAGEPLRAPRRFAFATQDPPTVSGFQVRIAADELPEAAPSLVLGPTIDADSAERRLAVAPADAETLSPDTTARNVSGSSPVRIGFSTPMNRAATEDRFSINPVVEGDLSWEGGDLVFTPAKRLEAGGRYTISLAGARDGVGNEVGGKSNFSFVVRAAPQITKTSPVLDAEGVEPATVEMWFSQPMDVEATNAAFALTDTATGRLVSGWLTWNENATQIVYSPQRALTGGRTFEVALGEGARDVDGNPITATWSFTTKAAPLVARAASAPAAAVAAAPAPSSSLVGYALNQINASRAAYGFAPVVLDGAMSVVAAAHAYDQAVHRYFSHYSRNGASVQQRHAAAGTSFGMISENQCSYNGQTAAFTLEWCHAAFMAEPYPGYWNHIGNILNPRWTRVGIGIGDTGSRVVITWDFSN